MHWLILTIFQITSYLWTFLFSINFYFFQFNWSKYSFFFYSLLNKMYSILNEYFIFSQNNLIITVKHNVSVFFFVKSESTWNVDRWNKLLNEV